MAYFGGGGVTDELHPSLRIYIDCFLSAPMPKMYPRGGGPWDQDPILMRDFRVIRDMEVTWKNREREQEGGSSGLGNSLDEYVKQLEEDGDI